MLMTRTGNARNLLFTVLTGTAMLLASRSAQALTVTNPFAGSNTVARVGNITGPDVAGAGIVFRTGSPARCAFVRIAAANSEGLTEDVIVSMGDGADSVTIHTGIPASFCSQFSVAPLAYNDFTLDFILDGGDDRMVAGTGDTWIYGNAGNDHIKSLNPTGRLFGGDGNDVLVAASSSGSGEELHGGAGDDCLEKTVGSANVLDCGEGFDLRAGAALFIFACDQTTSRCPF
jgi:Ca2+-binding RTX toxin-like protein